MSPSPREVDARLNQFGGLYRLGLSLRAARGRLLSRAQLLCRSLQLGRQASAEETSRLQLGCDEGDVAVTAVSSGTTHWLGQGYSALFDSESLQGWRVHALLVGVAPAAGGRSDFLARGAEAAVLVRFVGGTPAALLTALQTGRHHLVLGDTQALRLSGGSLIDSSP